MCVCVHVHSCACVLPRVPVWVPERTSAYLKDVHRTWDWGPALLEGSSCGNPSPLEL